ncbi:MAG TPA: glycosyltransferase [Chthoniobacteraceae bacterium]
MSAPSHIGLVAQGGAGWPGGSEYIRNLIRAVRANPNPPRLSIVCGPAQAAEWESQADALMVVPPHRKSLLDRFCAPHAELARAVREAGIEFVYPLTYDNRYNLGIDLPLGQALGTCRWAGWIPDFQHRYLPHLFSEKEIGRRDRGIEQLVADAPKIVLSSGSAAADLARYYPAAEARSEVLTFATFPHPGWYTDFDAEDLGWLPERFFLVSNQFWKHKNHLLLFEALALLASRGIRPVVVCTGQLADFRDADYPNLILQTLHRTRVANQVVLLGNLARRTQIELMRRALAVVQPSRFEGWSTVVEDARVLGQQILLSDLPVHREQNPPNARFFSPDSAEELANALAEAWETLQPGPHHERENVARAAAEERIRGVGRRFLEIAAT